MPSLVQLPRRGGFVVFLVVMRLGHPSPLSKQSIQYMSLVCQPLVRSKGLFCSAFPRELPSLFPLPFPSTARPACSFPSCRELSQQDCAGRVRGRGFSSRGTAVSPTLTEPPVGASGSSAAQAGTLYPGLESFLQSQTLVLRYSLRLTMYYFYYLPFAACIITDVTLRTLSLSGDFSSCACVSWWHFLNLFMS